MSSLQRKRVAVYARFSSANQNDSSIDDQVRRCTEHVERAGGTVESQLVFADYAVSGASLARPAFEQMMALVQAKQVDVIVTEDLSRISRDFADSADLYRQLRYLEVPLVGVADGIDTGDRHSKLAYHVKGLMADLYLDDLRDKTKRGLEGRARRGLSTGGLPYGYRSEPNEAQDGHQILIHDGHAEVVRRIFRMYAAGDSFVAIAKSLHREGVPGPRAHTRHRQKGWVPNTIRAMLANETYVGRFSYGKREWRKVPGTNKRRPRKRPASEVLTFERPELRIIDEELWTTVQARLAEVRKAFAGRKNRGFTKVRGKYPLSGLLTCGVCGGSMTIVGGSGGHAYYGCTAAKKRGTCTNRLTVREGVARRRILGELKHRLTRPAAIRRLRKRVAEGLAKMNRESTSRLRDHEQRLARTRARIDKLVMAVADGLDSESVRMTLRDLEAQARADEAAIEAIERTASQPIHLPSVDEIVGRALDLDAIMEAEPLRARAALARFFEEGRVELVPEGDVYVAKSRVLPLVLLDPQNTSPQPEGPGRARTMTSCAGRI